MGDSADTALKKAASMVHLTKTLPNLKIATTLAVYDWNKEVYTTPIPILTATFFGGPETPNTQPPARSVEASEFKGPNFPLVPRRSPRKLPQTQQA